MRASCFVVTLAVCGLVVEPANLQAQQVKPTNLLRLPGVRVDRSTLSAAEAKDIGKWIDGNPATTAALPASTTTPLEIVFEFGKEVTLERISLRLASATAPPRMELLVSNITAAAGFQLLRGDNLRATTSAQEFRFPPIGARWLLVRFIPPEKSERIAMAELECWGQEGPPRSHYAFKEAPARAFAVLERLKALSSLDLKLTDDEKALFADVHDGKFRGWSLAEAALLADGVQDRARRKAYLKKIDQLVAEATKATAKLKTPDKKGDLLLRFLHEQALTKGYRSGQTTLSGILDSQTFNCVSSAMLFNIVALRLGLDARAIEVPDHAFSVTYAGTRAMDVETTTPRGFNPARDRDAVRDFEKMTGFQYIPDRDRGQRREVREAGLVAIIYYNRGVEADKEKRHHEALLHYFRAMSLDREFDSAIKNALAVLANWGVELAREKKFKEGLAVLAAGLELAPKDATLLHNRKVFWSQWADTLTGEGKTAEALGVLHQAIREVPAEAESFRAQLPWIFLRKGEALVKAGKWEEAHEAVALGVEKLEGKPREEVLRWQRDLPLRRVASLRDGHHYDKAVAILAGALKREPANQRYADSLCYTVQQWVRSVFEREGEKPAFEVLRTQVSAYPKVAGLNAVAVSHVYRLLDGCLQKGKPEEGLGILDRHREVIGKAEKMRDATGYFIDRWASALIKKGDHSGALDAYDGALKRVPGDRHLTSNRIYQMQEWVSATHKEAGEEKAREVLRKLRQRYPEEKALDGIARNQARRATDALVREGKHEAAVKATEGYGPLLAGEEKGRQEAVRSLRSIYDTWSGGYRDKKEWQKAIDVYTGALERFPKDSHLEGNAVYTWETWAATFREKKEWDKAIGIYEKGLKQFPKDFTLKNNLDYCKAMKKSG